MTKQTKKPTNVATSVALLGIIDTIAATQKVWSKEYDSVNKKLYAILADCYSVTNDIRNASTKVTKEFNDALAERGYKRLSATRTETKVIRVVFGDIGTNRAAGYATVLVEAKKHGVTKKGLSKWIKQHGGIEEVRRNGAGGKTSEQRRDEVVLNTTKALDVLPELDLKTLTKLEGLDYSVVVMRKNSDGTAVPVAEIQSLSVVKNALVSLKLEEAGVTATENENNKVKLEQQAKIIAKAVEMLKKNDVDLSQIKLAA